MNTTQRTIEDIREENRWCLLRLNDILTQPDYSEEQEEEKEILKFDILINSLIISAWTFLN